MGMGAYNPSRLNINIFAFLDKLLDQSSDGVLIINREGSILYVNEMICELLNFTKDELLGASIKDIYINPISPPPVSSEVTLRKSDGGTLTCFEFARALEGEENLYCKLIKSEKNTDKKEDSLRSIKKMLTISEEINHLIAWERSSRSLIRKVCKTLANLREDLQVRIGHFNKEKVEIVQRTGHNKEELEYTVDPGEVPCLEALMTENRKMGSISIDYLCKECSLNGNNSTRRLVIPLSIEDRLYGVMWFHYSSEVFTSEELSLIYELAGDLALALKAIEVEQKRNEALDKMRENLEYFEYLADRLRNPLAIMRGFIDVKEDVGTDRTFREISKQINKMNRILDNLRIKEEETFRLRESLNK
ncbi:MAG: PAS domain-containing protein [Archaeoglobaceae archaeon]